MNIIAKTAIYCRLSKDDEKIGESVSIETQKMMLSQFCQENGFSIFDYYVDDGFSGLHFQRPGFQKMLHDMEEKKEMIAKYHSHWIIIMSSAVSLLYVGLNGTRYG